MVELTSPRHALSASVCPMARNITLTLQRTGQFSVRYTRDHAHQCGPTLEADIMNYDVTLTVGDEALDSNGFVIDNFAIEHYFHDTYHELPVFQSCERIALRALRDFKSTLGEKLLAAKVTISGMPVARITAEEKWG